MQKKAFLVVGPESSGTKLLTQLFIEVGYIGSSGDNQFFDGHDHNTLSKYTENIVWRSSLPHGKAWIDIKERKIKCEKAGFKVYVIGIAREMSSTIQSQLKIRHTSSLEEAFINYTAAFVIIAKVMDYFITYEDLVVDYKSAMKRMFSFLNIKGCDEKINELNISIYNANDKYS